MDISDVAVKAYQTSHIRMEAKRKALESIVNKPAPAPQAPEPTEEQKPTDTIPARVSSNV